MANIVIDASWYKEFADAIALRPYLYLGRLNAQGFYDLIKNVLSDIIFCSAGKDALLTILMENSRTYKVTVSGALDKKIIAAIFSKFSCCHILCATCASCRIYKSDGEQVLQEFFEYGQLIDSNCSAHNSAPGIEISFKLNEDYFKTGLGYHELSELCFELAVLNKNIKIFLKGKSEPHNSQNYYHFPEGMKHLLDTLCNKAFHFLPVVFIDEFFNGNYYQIGIAFQQKHYLDIDRVSYAGYGRTIEGGSLDEGIISGMMDVRRKYRKVYSSNDDCPISRYHFKGRMIVVCQVVSDGNCYNYYGSLRNKLNMPQMKKDVRRLVRERVSFIFENNAELAAAACNT